MQDLTLLLSAAADGLALQRLRFGPEVLSGTIVLCLERP